MRVISLAPSNTEILYRIGAGEKIVATTSLCNYPEEAVRKPSVGGWTDPDPDRIGKLDPDLLLASDDLQDMAVETLRDQGFDVKQFTPHNLEQVYESIIEIGVTVNRESEARKLVEEMRNNLSEVSLDGRPRIYCEEWMDPPMVSGNWVPDMVRELGGDYFIEEGRSRGFDLEDLRKFDPDYIFLNVCGAGSNLEASEILERDGWSSITAVENENVYVIEDALLNRPGPRLVEGARTMESFV